MMFYTACMSLIFAEEHCKRFDTTWIMKKKYSSRMSSFVSVLPVFTSQRIEKDFNGMYFHL